MNIHEQKHNQIIADIKAGKKVSPLKAIKYWCLECNGYQQDEVKTCGSGECILWAFKTGKNKSGGQNVKRVLTDEQKKAIRDRFAQYRRVKKV